jgi:uncharacterized SAM-binding protein YcdF (DUF218 family)
VILGGGRRSGAIKYPQYQDQSIEARAKAVFEKYGLKVTPAPMGFYQKDQFHPLDFYPSTVGIERTGFFWSEALGLIWYRIKL